MLKPAIALAVLSLGIAACDKKADPPAAEANDANIVLPPSEDPSVQPVDRPTRRPPNRRPHNPDDRTTLTIAPIRRPDEPDDR